MYVWGMEGMWTSVSCDISRYAVSPKTGFISMCVCAKSVLLNLCELSARNDSIARSELTISIIKGNSFVVHELVNKVMKKKLITK